MWEFYLTHWFFSNSLFKKTLKFAFIKNLETKNIQFLPKKYQTTKLPNYQSTKNGSSSIFVYFKHDQKTGKQEIETYSNTAIAVK
jgi:hypothetical protein